MRGSLFLGIDASFNLKFRIAEYLREEGSYDSQCEHESGEIPTEKAEWFHDVPNFRSDLIYCNSEFYF